MQMLFVKLRSLIWGLFLFLFPISLHAQLKVEAQLRTRAELRDGYRSMLSSSEDPSFIVSQRTRLALIYKTELLSLKVVPQDVRVWGDEMRASSTGVYGDDASLDLHEAYAELKLNDQSSLKLGRQELSYDYERLLARRNWNQHGLAYDAVLIKWQRHAWQVHIAGSWNSLSETTANNLYLPERIKSLNFVWINRELGKHTNLSVLHIASGITETDSTNTLHFRQTTGAYLKAHTDKLRARGNVYFQYGKNNAGNTISAFIVDADICYEFGKIVSGVGGSYLSGDEDVTDKSDHLFDVLYGARHRYFGHMDYFRNMSSHTRGGGLVDLYAYLNFRLKDHLQLKNTGHYFRLAETNQLTPQSRRLGYENELECKYTFAKWGALKSAWVLYAPTDALCQLQGVSDKKMQHFFFLELTLTPTLFAFDKGLE